MVNARGGQRVRSRIPRRLKVYDFSVQDTSKMSTSSPEAVKKLLENVQTDLRSLSMECKKKFPPVKEVSEASKLVQVSRSRLHIPV